jgi:hypothetical protein
VLEILYIRISMISSSGRTVVVLLYLLERMPNTD